MSFELFFQLNHHHARPKRILESGNGYEIDKSSVLSHRRRLRPLPYLSEFAASGGAAVFENSSILPLLLEQHSHLCELHHDDKNDGSSALVEEPAESKTLHQSTTAEPEEQVQNNPSGLTTPTLFTLEDPSLSTLTQAQHERYLKLLEMIPKGAPNMKRKKMDTKQKRLLEEFQTLKVAVENERTKYKDSIKSFRELNVNRFLIGFHPKGMDSSTTCYGIKAKQLLQRIIDEPLRTLRQWRDRWNSARIASGSMALVDRDVPIPTTAPMYFGSCIQTVALHVERCEISDCDIYVPPLDSYHDTTKGSRERRRFDLGEFHAKVTLEEVSEGHSELGGSAKIAVGLDQKLLDTETSDEMGKETPLLTSYKGHTREDISFCLLQNDDRAKKLALQHNVCVLLTSEAFSVLLNRPGNKGCRWKIPVFLESIEAGNNNKSAQKLLTIFEDPLPRSCNPREWMIRAFSGPLDEFILSSSSSAQSHSTSISTTDQATSSVSEETQPQPTVQFVYSLIKLPTSDKRSSETVIVRSVNDIFDEENLPIHRLVKLEYFYSPYSYLEEYTAYERVQWIKEKLLQPRSRVIVGRVDPCNGTLIALEEKNIATALAAEKNSHFDPMPHFQVAGIIVKASKLLLKERNQHSCCYMFCFPSHCFDTSSTAASHSASIHPAVTNDLPTICVRAELLAAESVLMNMDSLLSCFRMFEWDDKKKSGRISYTFPFDKVDL
jgi:hypothetical protein